MPVIYLIKEELRDRPIESNEEFIELIKSGAIIPIGPDTEEREKKIDEIADKLAIVGLGPGPGLTAAELAALNAHTSILTPNHIKGPETRLQKDQKKNEGQKIFDSVKLLKKNELMFDKPQSKFHK